MHLVDLQDYLRSVDGQDIHGATTKAVGSLSRAQYLGWPVEHPIPEFIASQVGTDIAMGKMSPEVIAKVYFIKARAKNQTYAKEFALLRVGMLMAGFYPDAKCIEIDRNVAVTDEAVTTLMGTDNDWILDNIAMYQRAGYILPFASEYVFSRCETV
ncbi:unnamed protein product [Pylaiella littoralis]